ncbi:MAG: flagellar export chaperone FliS [Pirellulaceae bacterium]|nr:flagellar protein FliS [Planctomycetales bacterium]
MKKPFQIYKQQKRVGWTRVDMLIALYDAGIRNIRQCREAMSEGNPSQTQQHRLHALRIILEIQAGLDSKYGEVPNNIARLCDFCSHALLHGDSTQLATAEHVLQTVRDGFAGIRDEAAALEMEGQIPPLADANYVHTTV